MQWSPTAPTIAQFVPCLFCITTSVVCSFVTGVIFFDYVFHVGFSYPFAQKYLSRTLKLVYKKKMRRKRSATKRSSLYATFSPLYKFQDDIWCGIIYLNYKGSRAPLSLYRQTHLVIVSRKKQTLHVTYDMSTSISKYRLDRRAGQHGSRPSVCGQAEVEKSVTGHHYSEVTSFGWSTRKRYRTLNTKLHHNMCIDSINTTTMKGSIKLSQCISQCNFLEQNITFFQETHTIGHNTILFNDSELNGWTFIDSGL